MSYVSPDHDPDGRHDRAPDGPRPLRRGPLTVTVAALVPAALVGWLIFHAANSGGSGGSDRQRADAAPTSTTPSAAQPSAAPTRSGQATASASASPSASASKQDTAQSGAASGPLAGKVIVIDPGHNPGNRDHTAEINRQVDVGTDHKECDTTGTATNAGYPEAQFTLDVSRRLKTLLEKEGAKVVLTQDGHRAWGPCVDQRARIGNDAHADAAISIHADGSAAGNRGFHVILPKAVHAGAADTRSIAAPSRNLGERIVGKFVQYTGSAPSNYIGNGTGLDVRSDLGGLNLSTVPKVFIECGNMRDPKDAALVTSGAWRQKAAEGISAGLESFLRG